MTSTWIWISVVLNDTNSSRGSVGSHGTKRESILLGRICEEPGPRAHASVSATAAAPSPSITPPLPRGRGVVALIRALPTWCRPFLRCHRCPPDCRPHVRIVTIIVSHMGGHSLDKYNGLEWGLSTFRNGPYSLVYPSTTWCTMQHVVVQGTDGL